MQIMIYIDLKHEETKRMHEQEDFRLLTSKLKAFNYNLTWSETLVERGSAMSITINTQNQQPQETSLKVWAGDTLFALYMFVGGSSDRRPITIRTVLDHFEALILQENDELLKQLYREEAERYHQAMHTKG